MRMFQEYGLSPEAEQWLLENCQVVGRDKCPHCGEFTKTQLKVVSTKKEDHFYGDGPHFATYVNKQGFFVKEVTQFEAHSSGPCHFKCLQLEDGTKVGKWSAEQINHMLGDIFLVEE